MAYKLSGAARQDIIDIYLRSEDAFGEAHAERYLSGLHATLALLADNPRIARERSELTRPVRIHPYKAHIVVYRLDGDDILILRLRYGHEDWQAAPEDS